MAEPTLGLTLMVRPMRVLCQQPRMTVDRSSIAYLAYWDTAVILAAGSSMLIGQMLTDQRRQSMR